MPLTPDPYEIENAPDHAGATANVTEGVETDHRQEEDLK